MNAVMLRAGYKVSSSKSKSRSKSGLKTESKSRSRPPEPEVKSMARKIMEIIKQ